MERDELKKTMILLDRVIMSMDMKRFPLGLFNGQMGICIYFFYLARLQDNAKYRAFAEKLLQQIFASASDISVISFPVGLSGIGWGIHHLLEEGFVTGSADDVLQDVDDVLFRTVHFEWLDDEKRRKSDFIWLLLYYADRLRTMKNKEEKKLAQKTVARILNRIEDSYSDTFWEQPAIFNIERYDLAFYLMVLGKLYELGFYNDNRNSVESIYHFFKERYDKIPRIGELNNVGIRKEKQEEFNRTYRNSQESLQQAEHYEEIERDMFLNAANYRSLTLFLHRYSGFVFRDYTDLLFDKETVQYIPTGTCLPFTKKMFVTVNGKILPCERIGHQFALGKLTETGIDLNPEQIADTYNDYYMKLAPMCGKCRNNKACIQCMFNMQGLNARPVCYGYMNEENFQNYVNRQMQFLEKHPEAYQEIMEKVIMV